MQNFKELIFEEMVTIEGGKKFWDTFGGKLLFATCVAILGGLVKLGFDQLQ